MEWFPILIKTVLLPMFVFYCTYRILSICVLLSWCCTAAGTLKFCHLSISLFINRNHGFVFIETVIQFLDYSITEENIQQKYHFKKLNSPHLLANLGIHSYSH